MQYRSFEEKCSALKVKRKVAAIGKRQWCLTSIAYILKSSIACLLAGIFRSASLSSPVGSVLRCIPWAALHSVRLRLFIARSLSSSHDASKIIYTRLRQFFLFALRLALSSLPLLHVHVHQRRAPTRSRPDGLSGLYLLLRYFM